jgi:hypothetical protein
MYSDSYPTHFTCHNFLALIRKITGVSSRSILENDRHQSQNLLEKEKRVKKILARVKDMTAEEQVKNI